MDDTYAIHTDYDKIFRELNRLQTDDEDNKTGIDNPIHR